MIYDLWSMTIYDDLWWSMMIFDTWWLYDMIWYDRVCIWINKLNPYCHRGHVLKLKKQFCNSELVQAEEKYFKNVAKVFEKLDTSGDVAWFLFCQHYSWDLFVVVGASCAVSKMLKWVFFPILYTRDTHASACPYVLVVSVTTYSSLPTCVLDYLLHRFVKYEPKEGTEPPILRNLCSLSGGFPHTRCTHQKMLWSGDGLLSWSEFEQLLEDPKLRFLLDKLEIAAGDACLEIHGWQQSFCTFAPLCKN